MLDCYGLTNNPLFTASAKRSRRVPVPARGAIDGLPLLKGRVGDYTLVGDQSKLSTTAEMSCTHEKRTSASHDRYAGGKHQWTLNTRIASNLSLAK